MWLILTDTIPNMDRYRDYYQQIQSVYDDQMHNVRRVIIMDIERTYAKQTSHETKNRMFRVLYSYAKRNMDTGYCQGINFIVYYLLELGFSEERTFWMLVYIVENLIPKGYYSNMAPVIADIRLFKYILNIRHPELSLHFQHLNADLNYFLIPWYIMIFTNLKNLYVR